MKNIRSSLYLSMLFASFLISCGSKTREPQQTEIHGQIFVVTKAGVNLPLGDVKITFHSLTETNKWLAGVRQAAEPTVKEVSELTADINSRIAEIKQLWDKIEIEEGKHSALVKEGSDPAEQKRLWEDIAATRKQVDTLASKKADVITRKLVVAESLDMAKDPNQSRPVALARTTTDASGSFCTTAPKEEPIVAFAIAKRSISPTEEENYVWLVRVAPNELNNLILSNSNLTPTAFIYGSSEL